MDEVEKKGRRDPEKEKFWRDLISQQGGSGKSVRDFCAEKGLKENQFYCWRRELKQRDAEKACGNGFMELIGPGRKNGWAGVSIQVDERLSIVVERGFDPETLKAALACTCAGVAG